MLYLEIVLLAGLAYFGARGLVKKKWWKELSFFAVIFAMGATLLILQTQGVKLPYVVDELNKFFKNTLHLSYD